MLSYSIFNPEHNREIFEIVEVNSEENWVQLV